MKIEKKSQDILYSMIVPAFNAESTLVRCLESIVSARKNYDVELLLVDDGSTDDTRAICWSYVQKYSWIFLFSQENGGVSRARRAALLHARGAYVAYADADDTIEESFFDIVQEKIVSTDADMVIFGHTRILCDGTQIPRPNVNALLRKSDIQYIQFSILDNWGIFFSSCCRVVRREIAMKFNMDLKILIGSDTIFNIFCINNSEKIIVFENCIYNYHERNGSVTGNSLKKDLLSSFESHYNARKDIQYFPDDIEILKKIKIDFSRAYLGHILIYLLNNLKHISFFERWFEIRRIRDSFIYKECVAYYDDRHASPWVARIAASFIARKYWTTLVLLWMGWNLPKPATLRAALGRVLKSIRPK